MNFVWTCINDVCLIPFFNNIQCRSETVTRLEKKPPSEWKLLPRNKRMRGYDHHGILHWWHLVRLWRKHQLLLPIELLKLKTNHFWLLKHLRRQKESQRWQKILMHCYSLWKRSMNDVVLFRRQFHIVDSHSLKCDPDWFFFHDFGVSTAGSRGEIVLLAWAVRCKW